MAHCKSYVMNLEFFKPHDYLSLNCLEYTHPSGAVYIGFFRRKGIIIASGNILKLVQGSPQDNLSDG